MSISEKTKEYQKKYREAHKDKSREYQREYQKQYRKSNPEKMKEKDKRRYARNPTYHIESCKEWRNENPEKANKCQREYSRMKCLTDPSFRIARNLRGRIKRAIKNITRGVGKKHFHSIELLGCTPQEYKIYLEKQFKEGMTWDNYGEWHIDHIKPCASFDLLDSEEQKRCFHYTNTQPLWANENISKSDKLIS